MNSNKENKVLLVLKVALGTAAVCAALMSCQNENILVDDEYGQGAQTIDFASGFVDSRVQTKADPVNLEQYNTTMGVWGWRSDSEVTDELTFKNQLVEFVDTKWTYTPPKYWVSKSNYRFYAYSPQTSAAAIDQASGYISIPGIKTDGTDWMVARAGQKIKTLATGYTVEFTMQHILFKLEVRARVTDAVANDPGVVSVVMDKVQVGNFVSKGDFSQKFDYLPSGSEYASEWSLDDNATKASFKNLKDNVLARTYTTLIDTMSVPQPMTDDMDLLVTYKMTFSDGRVEDYIFRNPLKSIFNVASEMDLLGGNSYRISLIIGPETITFDAGSEVWNEQFESSGFIN